MAKYSYITDKTNDNRKIQVESAVRDGEGKNIVNNYAKQNGNYQTMTVGLANNLDTKVVQNDVDAYTFRTAGGSLEIGDYCKEKAIVGGTVAFNQLYKSTKATFTALGLTFTNNNDGSWTINGSTNFDTDTSDVILDNQDTYYYNGHKYLFGAVKTTGIQSYIGKLGNWVGATNGYKVLECTATEHNVFFNIRIYKNSTFNNFKIYPQIIDLTKMFGSTIADYIYSLEQATAGSGVAWFKRYFPNTYYAYNTGILVNVKTSGKKYVGFNQFDGSKATFGKSLATGNGGWYNNENAFTSDFIKVIPNTQYHLHIGRTFGNIYICRYDANKNWLASYQAYTTAETTIGTGNGEYLRFSVQGYGASYGNDVNFNFHYDGERDGEYEPYESNEYALSPVELRGIPKKDAQGNLYFDGDSYTPDGKVVRKYKEITPTTLISNYQNLNGDTIGVVANDTVDNDGHEASFNPNIIDSRGLVVTYGDKQYGGSWEGGDGSISISTNNRISICIKGITSVAALTTWLTNNPISIVYPIKTPTEEETDTYQETQQVDNWGTEQYLPPESDTRLCEVPVGHSTDYLLDIKSKVEIAPDLPSDDGVYACKVESGTAEYVPLGTWLVANGYIKLTDINGYDSSKTQTLKNVNGTLTWVDD